MPMSRLDQLELRLRCRHIVLVMDYFDEEHLCPWNYVERDGKGGHEVFTTVLVKGDDGIEEAVPVSLGLVASPREAHAALQVYEHWDVAVARLCKKEPTDDDPAVAALLALPVVQGPSSLG